MLTEEEKQKVDREVADILMEIQNSNQSETAKIIEAFQAGVKFWEEKRKAGD